MSLTLPAHWLCLASGGWRDATLHMPRWRQIGILVNRAPKQGPFVQEFLARWRAGDWRRFQAKLLTVAMPPPASLLWGESRQPLLLFRESAEHWTWWREAFCLGFDRMRQGPKSAGRPGPPVISDSPHDVSLPLSRRLCAIFNTDAPTAVFVSELPLKTVCMLRDTMGEKTLPSVCTKAEAWSGQKV